MSKRHEDREGRRDLKQEDGALTEEKRRDIQGKYYLQRTHKQVLSKAREEDYFICACYTC